MFGSETERESEVGVETASGVDTLRGCEVQDVSIVTIKPNKVMRRRKGLIFLPDKKLMRKTSTSQQDSISQGAKQPSAGGHSGNDPFQIIILARLLHAH